MSQEIILSSWNEIEKYINEKGFLEVVQRTKNKRYKEFLNIQISKLVNPDEIKKVNHLLIQNNKNLMALSNQVNLLNSLNYLNLFLQGANLCTTAAGFAIMYKKLDQIQNQIKELEKSFKTLYDKNLSKTFNEITLEHQEMLDRIRIRKQFTSKEYHSLISKEYVLLSDLYKAFMDEFTNELNDILYFICMLSSMLSSTICLFDKQYYFENKDELGKECWHSSHGKWMSIYDELTSKEFREKLEDYMFINRGFNQYETDLMIVSTFDSFKEAKQTIVDYQRLISLFETEIEKFDMCMAHEIEKEYQQKLLS